MYNDPALLPIAPELLAVVATLLATVLATLLAAVAVGATAAFPGWSAHWPHRIARAVVLLFTVTYLTIAGVGTFMLADALLGSGEIGRGDLRYCRDAIGFGAATLLALFIVKTVTPPAPPSVRTVPASSAIWVIAFFLILGLYAVQSSIELHDNFRQVSMALAVLLAAGIACEVVYDRFDIRASARHRLQDRQDLLSVIQGSSGSLGFPLQPCILVPQGRIEHAIAAWSHAQQLYVWLETTAAQQLADHVYSRPLAEQGASGARYLLDLKAPTGFQKSCFCMIDAATGEAFCAEGSGGVVKVPLWRIGALGFERSFSTLSTQDTQLSPLLLDPAEEERTNR